MLDVIDSTWSKAQGYVGSFLGLSLTQKPTGKALSREFPAHPTTCSGKVSYVSVLQIASEIKIISISLVGLCSTFSLQNMVGNELVSYEQNVYLSRLHIKFFVSLWERTILHLLPRTLTPVTLRRPAPPSPHPRDFSFDFHEHLTCLDSLLIWFRMFSWFDHSMDIFISRL